MNAPLVPPPDAADRLPHERAVWRVGSFQLPSEAERASPLQVSIDRGGFIEQARANEVDWGQVSRWRFGWAPEGK